MSQYRRAPEIIVWFLLKLLTCLIFCSLLRKCSTSFPSTRWLIPARGPSGGMAELPGLWPITPPPKASVLKSRIWKEEPPTTRIQSDGRRWERPMNCGPQPYSSCGSFGEWVPAMISRPVSRLPGAVLPPRARRKGLNHDGLPRQVKTAGRAGHALSNKEPRPETVPVLEAFLDTLDRTVGT